LTLAYLDECGFSPSQPVNYSGTLAGECKRVPYENPCGRRVNAIERVFGGIKHHDLAARRYATVDGLMDAVDDAFSTAEARLIIRRHHEHQLCQAAFYPSISTVKPP
jgi:hypothetical protein